MLSSVSTLWSGQAKLCRGEDASHIWEVNDRAGGSINMDPAGPVREGTVRRRDWGRGTIQKDVHLPQVMEGFGIVEMPGHRNSSIACALRAGKDGRRGRVFSLPKRRLERAACPFPGNEPLMVIP